MYYLRCTECMEVFEETDLAARGEKCFCGENDFVEVFKCKICGEYFNEEEDYNPVYFDYCEKCLLETLKDEVIMLEYVTSSKEMKIEFFLNYVHDCWINATSCWVNTTMYGGISDEMLNFMIAKTPYKDKLRDFCECDLYQFAEWYDERAARGVNNNDSIFQHR